MRKLGASYALFGFNSENDLLALVRSLNTGGAAGVPNLAWMDDAGAFHASSFSWESPSLEGDAVPWKEWGLPPEGATLQVRASSGCSFHCAFCTYPVTARGYHMMDIKAVEAQLGELAALGVRSLIFIDDTFNVPLERFREIVDLLGRHQFRWYSFFRPQFCDESLAAAMKQSGCDGVYMGMESANDGVLAAMDKKARVADYRRGLALLKRAGIPTFAAFIVGYPGETAATLEDDRAFIENEGLDFYSLKEFYYLHDASIHGRGEEYGLSGEGNNWKHATMDSLGASAAKMDLFRRVNNCVYVDPDSGLWLLAYLRDRGLEWTAIREALSAFNAMARRDLEGNYGDKADLFARIKGCLGAEKPC
jgi:p-methyltransferase